MRFLFAMLLAIPLCAQQPAEGAPHKRTFGPPKNLEILTPDELMPAMHSFTRSLGVHCNFCHVEGDRASDANPKKLVARKMLGMVRRVNTSYFDGRQEVTCYTCHRGATQPLKVAPAPEPMPAPAPAEKSGE